MITMSSAMSHLLRFRSGIIGVLVVALGFLLGGCSAVRLAYDQGPMLVYWRLDSHLDLDAEQAVAARAAVARWFAWHRATQLPEYAAMLDQLAADAAGELGADRVCQRGEAVRRLVAQAWEHAVPALADLGRTLRPAQIDRLEERYRRQDEEFRRDYLQDDPAERARALLERTTSPLEMLYGPLNDAQRTAVVSSLAVSPLDPLRWFAERQARQRDRVAALRRLTAQGAEPAAFREVMATIGDQAMQSPRPAYQAYAARLEAHNCAAYARWHGLMTPTQRRHAVERLRAWAEDARVLSGERSSEAAHSGR
jgi:hypothetical protein